MTKACVYISSSMSSERHDVWVDINTLQWEAKMWPERIHHVDGLRWGGMRHYQDFFNKKTFQSKKHTTKVPLLKHRNTYPVVQLVCVPNGPKVKELRFSMQEDVFIDY